MKVFLNQKSDDYIAHIRTHNGIPKGEYSEHEVQTLYEHLQGTSKIAAINGSRFFAENIASVLGKYHDFGKGTEKFKNYLLERVQNPDDNSKRGTIDHSAGGAIHLYERFSKGKPLNILLSEIAALAISSHHGGLMDMISPNGDTPFNERIGKDKQVLAYHESRDAFDNMYSQPEIEGEFTFAIKELNDIVEKLKQAGIFSSFSVHLLTKLLFSCLIDADRYDTQLFMEDKEYKQSPSGSDFWGELAEILEKVLESMNCGENCSNHERKITELRRQISDACLSFGKTETGIYSLTVPTGGGKTLSSLRFALNHCKEHGKCRIIYVLPYTTIIEQNAKEIKDIFGSKADVLEHHSNVIKDNKNEDYKLATERWDAPVIFTTMVQFLNSIYSSGTQNMRRMQALTNSVIIFDEIQSIPIKCIDLFTSAVNFLSTVCNTTSVLCTATQPALDKTAHGLFKSEQAEITLNPMEIYKAFKRTSVVDKRIPGGYTISELAEFALEQMENKDSMLIIVNTKGDARKLYQKMKEKVADNHKDYNLVHLSKSMCPAHRTQALDKFKGLLGKEKVICISTQLIEAGVNISTQCVIRALAGIDSVAQAAGRCNRHGEYELCDVYIVNIRDENLANLAQIKRAQRQTYMLVEINTCNPPLFFH